MLSVVRGEPIIMITSQLKRVAELAPESVIDTYATPYEEANTESYYARNTKIIENADELYAFLVNGSKGVQDAIDKAKEL
ncbi:MAG: hypothetical protein LBP53_03695 [Candidatus Peribacteria bacterium]|jgi:hypothetical protein|nr:hypothetical protein [Candidatus Peribacteria bacterium]